MSARNSIGKRSIPRGHSTEDNDSFGMPPVFRQFPLMLTFYIGRNGFNALVAGLCPEVPRFGALRTRMSVDILGHRKTNLLVQLSSFSDDPDCSREVGFTPV